MPDRLLLYGVRQNNLRGFDLAIPHGKITVVTGVSGSGKSSLAFDTCYAEGQRRYLESLSTYARQFLERMPKPDVDRIENIPPAIALEQKNPVRTSRSTVGTATEIMDHLRLLFARAGTLHCPGCREPVRAETAETAADHLIAEAGGDRAFIGYPAPPVVCEDPAEGWKRLRQAGFLRLRLADGSVRSLDEPPPAGSALTGAMVVADRLAISPEEDERSRLLEALETSLDEGHGVALVECVSGRRWRFAAGGVCNRCGTKVPRVSPGLFSFNNPLGACPDCRGFGNTLRYAEEAVVPDPAKTLREGAIEVWTKPTWGWWQKELLRHARRLEIDLDTPWSRLPARQRKLVWDGDGRFDGVKGSFDYWEGKRYKIGVRVFLRRYQRPILCGTCKGDRLRPEALLSTLHGKTIAEVARLHVGEARAFFEGLRLAPASQAIASEPLGQVRSRLRFLDEVGLPYLTLDRATRTLSGGEMQRVHLANSLGAALTGTLYVLDEPSIGLHPRDTGALLAVLRRLSGRGNTVLVVEHDPDTMRAADWLVELGPGSGENGGRLLYSGPQADFLRKAPKESPTARYLRGELRIPVPAVRRKPVGGWLEISGCRATNLQGIALRVPLGLLVLVTGVSGSGKSSLVRDTLAAALLRHFEKRPDPAGPYDRIEGIDRIRGVVLLDQEPVGRTPRSNPATYVKAWEGIRKALASSPAARAEGLTPGDFSFNAGRGRCDVCRGEGAVKVEMHFLEDLFLPCEACHGTRFGEQVRGVRFRGKSAPEVLAMTVEEAAGHFRDFPGIVGRLRLLQEVGLGYLRLGQPATTLSGGESQRLKIAARLGEASPMRPPEKRSALPGRRRPAEGGGFLYILDEPTTGLHPQDIAVLLGVLDRLVGAGNTVLVVEHNLEVIRSADWIVDLGPGGGDAGGRIVAEGTPEKIAASRASITGRYLRPVLRGGKGPVIESRLP